MYTYFNIGLGIIVLKHYTSLAAVSLLGLDFPRIQLLGDTDVNKAKDGLMKGGFEGR